jgi:hypothetical protein
MESLEPCASLGMGDGYAMAERERSGFALISASHGFRTLVESFFQDDGGCHSHGSTCGGTQIGDYHIGFLFGHGFSFISAKRLTR